MVVIPIFRAFLARANPFMPKKQKRIYDYTGNVEIYAFLSATKSPVSMGPVQQRVMITDCS